MALRTAGEVGKLLKAVREFDSYIGVLGLFGGTAEQCLPSGRPAVNARLVLRELHDRLHRALVTTRFTRDLLHLPDTFAHGHIVRHPLHRLAQRGDVHAPSPA